MIRPKTVFALATALHQKGLQKLIYVNIRLVNSLLIFYEPLRLIIQQGYQTQTLKIDKQPKQNGYKALSFRLKTFLASKLRNESKRAFEQIVLY